MLVKMSLEEFGQELASDSPAPGGGSVAALSGALGAGLLSMVGRLTVGKKGYEGSQETAQRVEKEGDELRLELMELVDLDTAAFNEIMAAFKLPKETDEDKLNRGSAIQAAFHKAVDIPMTVAEKCVEILSLAWELKDKGNKNAASDLGVAAEASYAGLKGALMNVRINLPSIKDEIYVERARARADRLQKKAGEMRADIAETMETIIGP